MNLQTVRIWGVVGIALALAGCASASEIENRTEHTYQLVEGANQPAASIDDVAWLAGFWQGEAFGGTFEETWNPPSKGSMVGLFKLMGDEGVAFYEIILIVEENESLAMKVKHFTADFVSWETKEDYIKFPLVHLEKDAVHFSGFSIYRHTDDQMTAYLAMRRKEGVVEEKLTFTRQ